MQAGQTWGSSQFYFKCKGVMKRLKLGTWDKLTFLRNPLWLPGKRWGCYTGGERRWGPGLVLAVGVQSRRIHRGVHKGVAERDHWWGRAQHY